MVHLLLRRGEEKYIRSFLEKGEMCFNTMEYFRNVEKEEFAKKNGRKDPHEGAFSRKHYSKVKIEMIECDVENAVPIFLDGENFVVVDLMNGGNIFSMSSIFQSQLDLKTIDIDIATFGDSIIIITNPNEFLKRVESELKRQNLNYHFGAVKYYPDDYTGELGGPFDKNEFFEKQREFRIFIDSDAKDKILIEIGNIEDIACVFKGSYKITLGLTDGDQLVFKI